ncbi:MAG: hypothetical protein RO257_02310 [Candidatus Kapabacteria bacterium]|nr:hypothetical protein [Candidatus Kapabacteria bacterium]
MILTFDEVLESVENLEISQKEMLIDIVQKRMSLQRRNEIITDVRNSRKDYGSGKVNRGSSKDLMREILR